MLSPVRVTGPGWTAGLSPSSGDPPQDRGDTATGHHGRPRSGEQGQPAHPATGAGTGQPAAEAQRAPGFGGHTTCRYTVSPAADADTLSYGRNSSSSGSPGRTSRSTSRRSSSCSRPRPPQPVRARACPAPVGPAGGADTAVIRERPVPVLDRTQCRAHRATVISRCRRARAVSHTPGASTHCSHPAACARCVAGRCSTTQVRQPRGRAVRCRSRSRMRRSPRSTAVAGARMTAHQAHAAPRNCGSDTRARSSGINTPASNRAGSVSGPVFITLPPSGC